MTKEMAGRPPTYHSFLLRLWRESEHGTWRASLETVTTGERHGFPDLISLFAFLQAECQKELASEAEVPGQVPGNSRI